MKKTFVNLLSLAVLVSVLTTPAEACTSIILKAKDSSAVYGRTCEWGLFDLQSDLVMVPRNLSNTSKLDNGKQGMVWKNKYGFVAINAAHLPYYLDGMNETGLTVGALYLPGFAKFQNLKAGEESSTLNAAELVGYLLGQFKAVGEIRDRLPELRIVDNADIEKSFGAPLVLHFVITDSAGDSIVVEYVDAKLTIYNNKIGVMTNSPAYDWHLSNLRNYTQLASFAKYPGNDKVNGVNFNAFGAGAGMIGLPGDESPASRFVRAFFYTQTSVPLEDVDAAVNQASRILDNFDYPKGLVREGKSPDKELLNFTTWTVIGDIKNKRYYWWTEFNRQMRRVDLSQLNFTGDEMIASPLDKVRAENMEDRTKDFQK